jgi:hypothetical protein
VERAAGVLLAVGVGSCLASNPDWDKLEITGTDGSSGTTDQGSTSTTTTTNPTTTTAETTGPSTSTSSTSGEDDSGESETGGPNAVTVNASIAVCSSIVTLDYQACADYEGPNTLSIDVSASALGGDTLRAFLRFDRPPELESRTITALTLVLRTAGDEESGEGNSGAPWLAAPFDETSLQTAHPAVMDMLAPTQGETDPGTEVAWSLDPSAFDGTDAFYIAMVNESSEGVSYGDNTATVPPRLEIELD